jgi:ferrous iron transport protein B
MPCVAALGVILRELGKGYGWLAMGYLTVLAWVVSTLFYQLTVAKQVLWIVVPLLLLGMIAVIFWWLGRKTSWRHDTKRPGMMIPK